MSGSSFTLDINASFKSVSSNTVDIVQVNNWLSKTSLCWAAHFVVNVPFESSHLWPVKRLYCDWIISRHNVLTPLSWKRCIFQVTVKCFISRILSRRVRYHCCASWSLLDFLILSSVLSACFFFSTFSLSSSPSCESLEPHPVENLLCVSFILPTILKATKYFCPSWRTVTPPHRREGSTPSWHLG